MHYDQFFMRYTCSTDWYFKLWQIKYYWINIQVQSECTIDLYKGLYSGINARGRYILKGVCFGRGSKFNIATVASYIALLSESVYLLVSIGL